MIYFDYNATTPLCQVAKSAWLSSSDSFWYNTSSPYREAARARAQLEETRDRLASLLRIESERLVFNSGATEGNNTVFAAAAESAGPKAVVLVSSIEHPSVIASARKYFPEGVIEIPVGSHGVVDLELIEQRISLSQVALISVMAANNETGVLQPWQRIAGLCRGAGVPFHCDASQWFGKLDASLFDRCDYVTGCAHKFCGPKGIGFLATSKTASCPPLMLGGEQENGRRGGTENLPGVAAMVSSLEACDDLRKGSAEVQAELRTALESEISDRIPDTRIVGRESKRLWNTVSLIMPHSANGRWVSRLNGLGFAVSTGSACASGKAGPSHVLNAMGIGPEAAARSLRVSGGWETPECDWLALAQAMVKVHHELSSSDLPNGGAHVISV